MHILQPKHVRLKPAEAEEMLKKLNVSKTQLPKILSTDVSLPEDIEIGDVIRIERKSDEEKREYYRVVV